MVTGSHRSSNFQPFRSRGFVGCGIAVCGFMIILIEHWILSNYLIISLKDFLSVMRFQFWSPWWGSDFEYTLMVDPSFSVTVSWCPFCLFIEALIYPLISAMRFWYRVITLFSLDDEVLILSYHFLVFVNDFLSVINLMRFWYRVITSILCFLVMRFWFWMATFWFFNNFLSVIKSDEVLIPSNHLFGWIPL